MDHLHQGFVEIAKRGNIEGFRHIDAKGLWLPEMRYIWAIEAVRHSECARFTVRKLTTPLTVTESSDEALYAGCP